MLRQSGTVLIVICPITTLNKVSKNSPLTQRGELLSILAGHTSFNTLSCCRLSRCYKMSRTPYAASIMSSMFVGCLYGPIVFSTQMVVYSYTVYEVYSIFTGTNLHRNCTIVHYI